MAGSRKDKRTKEKERELTRELLKAALRSMAVDGKLPDPIVIQALEAGIDLSEFGIESSSPKGSSEADSEPSVSIGFQSSSQLAISTDLSPRTSFRRMPLLQ